jgi:hypothetical protein
MWHLRDLELHLILAVLVLLDLGGYPHTYGCVEVHDVSFIRKFELCPIPEELNHHEAVGVFCLL